MSVRLTTTYQLPESPVLLFAPLYLRWLNLTRLMNRVHVVHRLGISVAIFIVIALLVTKAYSHVPNRVSFQMKTI